MGIYKSNDESFNPLPLTEYSLQVFSTYGDASGSLVTPERPSFNRDMIDTNFVDGRIQVNNNPYFISWEPIDFNGYLAGNLVIASDLLLLAPENLIPK